MNRIMLRFRPIAPKPSDADAAAAAADLGKRNVSVKNGRRTKRKYVRVRGRKRTAGRSPEKQVVTTLQLLPEGEKSCCYTGHHHALGLSESDGYKLDDEVCYGKDSVWITVECITEIYMEGLGLGVSDREKISNLEGDTCPGFVSDGSNKVVWVNEAYRKLVAENGAWWLVVKEKLPCLAPSFACRVRMIQQTKHGHKWNRIVPCDVWRMDFPGFAWKLDVNTALGLGI
ncbi:hypothetical protein ACS0TY_028083 [Phlomoides rotata]